VSQHSQRVRTKQVIYNQHGPCSSCREDDPALKASSRPTNVERCRPLVAFVAKLGLYATKGDCRNRRLSPANVSAPPRQRLWQHATRRPNELFPLHIRQHHVRPPSWGSATICLENKSRRHGLRRRSSAADSPPWPQGRKFSLHSQQPSCASLVMGSGACVLNTSAYVRYEQRGPVCATTQPSRKARPRKEPRACHMRYYPTICRSRRGSPALLRPRSRSGAAWFCAVPNGLFGLLTCMSVTPSLPRDLAPSALLRLKAL
jgi:hypothetical protein